MKTHWLFLVLWLLPTSHLWAQRSNVKDAENFLEQGKLDLAAETIDHATRHKRTGDDPETWLLKARICEKLSASPNPAFAKTEQNPLKKALEAYLKASELDTKNRYKNQINKRIKRLRSGSQQKATQLFKQKQYAAALRSFELSLRISAMPQFFKRDTITFYNAGLAAEKAGNFSKAQKYYKKAIDLNYGDHRLYFARYKALRATGRNSEAIEVLKKGIEKFPKHNEVLLIELINSYLKSQKPERAVNFLELALEKDPENSLFYFTLGTLYDKKNQNDKAKENYLKAIEKNKSYFEAYYNLATLHYNTGVDILNSAEKIRAAGAYERQKARARSFFRKAKPYLERAASLKPKDTATLEMLKNVYLQLQMYYEAKQVKQVLNQ